MSTSLIYHTQGLRDYQYVTKKNGAGKIFITIELKHSCLRCPACGSYDFTSFFLKERKIKGIPLGNKKTVFIIRVRRLRCRNCGAERQERISCVPAPKARYTKALARSVIEMRPKMSIKDVASHFGLHWDTVKEIEKNYLERKYRNIRLRDVEVIGIDEVHTGQGFLTVVRDLNSGAVLHVGEGKGADSLAQLKKRLAVSKCKIKAVAVDLAPSYTAWIKENIPNANIVYDHFHLIKLMNTKIDNIRRKTMNEADEEMKKMLKHKRFLFLKNIENLESDGKQELEKLKEMFSDLGTATFMKECLRRIYSIAENRNEAKIAFEYWCKIADETGIGSLVNMAKTIRRHLDGILAYWTEGKLTSAGMEGFNNKLRWLIGQAYGYRDDEYFKLKIFDLPTINTRKAI